MGIQSRDEHLGREALRQHLVEQHQGIDIVTREEQLSSLEVGVVVEDIERRCHILIVELGAAERHRLVEHRQSITHTAIGLMGDEVERLVVSLDTLLRSDIAQILHAILNPYAVEVVDLTAREDGGDNLMLLGCCEHKDGVLGRLLQSLEEGVERRR